jgi:hypothetical protein
MKPLALVLAVVCCSAVGLSACGGQSKQDKAKSQVCSARADITKQVDSLKSLTIGSSTVSDVTTSLTAIQNDLQQIKNAQPNLDQKRKQQVQSATQTFTAQLQTILQDALKNLSLKNAKTQIQSAVAALENAYRQALAPISC